MNSTRRLLPFARNFNLTHQRSAKVFIGDREAWARCQRQARLGYTDFLLLPVSEDPFKYIWPVNGRDAIIFDPSPKVSRVAKLACLAMLEAGATAILVITKGGLNLSVSAADE